jgi:hypothetical protein
MVLELADYERAHAWALQRARIAAGLRLPTPPTLFGLAIRDDGIEAVVTLSVTAAVEADDRLRLEAAVLALASVDLLALMEPVAATAGSPVAITVRDDDYELTVVSPVAESFGMRLLPRARLLQ